MLEAAGWQVQNRSEMNLAAGPGVAVRELWTEVGPADYALFLGNRLVGIIEAKRAGSVLSKPPFGRKSSILVVADSGETEREQITYEREDFWATSSSPSTSPTTASRARLPGPRRLPRDAGAPTRNWSPATSATSTSSGCATRACSKRTTSPIRTSSPPRSPTTCAAPSSRSSRYSTTCALAERPARRVSKPLRFRAIDHSPSQ